MHLRRFTVTYVLAFVPSLCAVNLVNFVDLYAQTRQYDLRPGKKITLTDATFKQGSATIEPLQLPSFLRLTDFLRSRNRLSVEIGGYADNKGNDVQNTALSLARAEAVRTFLIQNGIAASRIRTRGYGSQYPLAPNTTDSGRTKNRRVEIVGLSALTGKLLATPDAAALAPEARITALKPSVQMMPAWENTWQEARMGDSLYEAFRVRTARGSEVDITFRNASTLHIADDALLMIYGFDAAAQNLPSLPTPSSNERTAKNITLERGDLLLRLKAMRTNDTFAVRTQVAEIGFNTGSVNASAKVRVDARKRSIVSVLQGRANVQVLQNDPRTGQTLDISEDFGIVIGDSSREAQFPQRLPPVPELLAPSERTPPLDSGILFKWNNAAYATRLEIAVSNDFTEMLYNAVQTRGEARVKLPEGTYFLRLTNLDSIGLESRSRLHGLTVSRFSATTASDDSRAPFGTVFSVGRFRWLEFFVLLVGVSLCWTGAVLSRPVLRRVGYGVVFVGSMLLLLL
jgi:outer membrane protein OmpA-like peptidoglycan-associated protein